MERFWSKVEKTDGCWLWIANHYESGYGQFKFEGRSVRAHRMAYELCVGPIPEGVNVLHHCDTPNCVKPTHLFLGTCADNSADMVSKGRSLLGVDHPLSQLNEEQVISIRVEYEAGATQQELATKYGVSQRTISKIVRYETWKHIGEKNG